MALFHLYPGIVSESDWPWKEWSPFFLDEQKGSSATAGPSTGDADKKPAEKEAAKEEDGAKEEEALEGLSGLFG